jgi:hypothetical protein
MEQQEWPSPVYEGPGRYDFRMESATRPAALGFIAGSEGEFRKRVWLSRKAMQNTYERFPGYSVSRVSWAFKAA